MNFIKVSLFIFGLFMSFVTFGMNKAELIAAIAKDSGLSKADSKRALDAFLSTSEYALQTGDKLSLVGFGSFSLNKNKRVKFHADRPLVYAGYQRYFKTFWSNIIQHNAETLSNNPLYKEGGQEGVNPFYEDRSYFSSSSFYAEAFLNIFTRLSPTELVSAPRDQKVDIATELNKYLQEVVTDYARAHEAAHVVQQKSGRIMQDSVEALLSQAIAQERHYLDPKAENLGLSQQQLLIALILYNAQAAGIDFGDGHVTVLKARERSTGHGHVTVLKLRDTNGHVTVLKAQSVDGHVTVLKARDHRGHVTVLKISDSNGHVTVLKVMESIGDAFSRALKSGQDIYLSQFGSFSIPKQAARKGRNPQTGKEIKIAAKNVVKFKAGSELSGKVN